MLEWVAIPFSRDLLDPVIETASLGSSALAGRYFTTAPPTKPQRRCGTYIQWNMGLPGGALVKNLPAPGRSHMLQGSFPTYDDYGAHVPQPLKPVCA